METKLDRISQQIQELWDEMGPDVHFTTEWMRRHEILWNQYIQEFRESSEKSRREFVEESRAQRAALFAMIDRLNEGGGGAARDG